MPASGRACALLAAALLAAACGPGLSYTMTSPQYSEQNHYVAPEIEVAFAFRDDHLVVRVANTGEGDISVDWDNAVFVTAAGQLVSLVRTGPPLVKRVPSGTNVTASLTLSVWYCQAPQRWHRREALGKAFVYANQLPGGSGQVRILLPVVRYGGDKAGTLENYEFAFDVMEGSTQRARRNDRPPEEDDDDLPF
jgi:hypothetical protein